MTSPMGDRVPPLSMTDAQEAELDRLQDEAVETISLIQPWEVYQDMALSDWSESLAHGVPLAIPDPWDADFEDLTLVQRNAWTDLTRALRELLLVHIDDDAIKGKACGGD